MKKTSLTILLASAIILGAGLFNQFSSSIELNIKIPNVAGMFTQWKQRNGKKYFSSSEQKYRFGVFYKNYIQVITHNSQNLGYTLTLNKFADLTDEEFKARFTGGYHTGRNDQPKCDSGFENFDISQLPEEIDWVAKGAVTSVKNQLRCASCYAFSAIGSLEGYHFLKENKLIEYSVQQVVDCSYLPPYNNMGCHGGFMSTSFWYIRDQGIELETTYPYTGLDMECRQGAPAYTIAGCTDVPYHDNDALKAAVAQQPVSVAIDAGVLKLYEKGIIGHLCGQSLDHGVLVVGYGKGDSTLHPHEEWWRVKNSWGEKWGEHGYFRIKRESGVKKSPCGINKAALVPK